jgi:hypothetical protein
MHTQNKPKMTFPKLGEVETFSSLLLTSTVVGHCHHTNCRSIDGSRSKEALNKSDLHSQLG